MRPLLVALILLCGVSEARARTIELGTDGIGASNTTASTGVRGVNRAFQIVDGSPTTITSSRPGGDLTYNYNLSPFGDLVDGDWVGYAGRSNLAYNTIDDPWIVVDENFVGPPTLEGPVYGTAVDPSNPPAWAAKGVGIHANGGVTFDLDYFRGKTEFGTTANQAFMLRGRSGANDFKRAGSISTSVLVDGQVQYVTPRLLWSQPTQPIVVGLPSTARYLTIGVTSGGDTIGADHGVFENLVLEPVDTATQTLFYRGTADFAVDDSLTGIYFSDDPNSLGTPLVTGPTGSYSASTNAKIWDPIAAVLEANHTYYLTAVVANSGGGPGGFRGSFHFDKGFLETNGRPELNTNLANWMVSSTAPGPDTIWDPAWAAPLAAGWYTGTGGISADAAWIWRQDGGTYASGTVYLRAALTPLPEPTSLALLALGAVGILWVRSRRRLG